MRATLLCYIVSIFILLDNLVCNILSRQNLSFQLRAKSSDPNIDIKMKFYVIQKAKKVLKQPKILVRVYLQPKLRLYS